MASLNVYKLSIKYKIGKKNVDADVLSSCKHPQEVKTIFSDMLNAISHSLLVMAQDYFIKAWLFPLLLYQIR